MPPTIPLTDQARAACEDLYAKLQAALDNTDDPGVYEELSAARTDVDNILTKDTEYRLQANTALYEALLGQIQDTTLSLKSLHDQILAIDNRLEIFGDVVGALAKVVSILPAA
jgi:hypothetical protein